MTNAPTTIVQTFTSIKPSSVSTTSKVISTLHTMTTTFLTTSIPTTRPSVPTATFGKV